jgi:hypothetical protein
MERALRIFVTTGFTVQTAMMDIEFEKLKPFMPDVALNTTAVWEHIGETERKIRVIKERARGTFNTLPYKKLPRIMVMGPRGAQCTASTQCLAEQFLQLDLTGWWQILWSSS